MSPRPSSLVGSPNASTSSLTSTLRRVLAPLTPILSVMETVAVTTYFCRKCCVNFSRARSPPGSPPARLKAAFSSSCLKSESCCSHKSGNCVMKAVNLASLSLPSTPPISLKRSSWVIFLLARCLFNASTICVSQTEARKSSPFWSTTSGAAICPKASIFFSKPSTCARASCRSFAATKRCSWSRRRPRWVSNSCWSLLS
mmetsp:Transcript_112809/g.329652  ORF Transcript_112809/g.329652 Transcript_112809/m.329652 type:complete len:200 (+) Transcript_112809:1501-2100(+)